MTKARHLLLLLSISLIINLVSPTAIPPDCDCNNVHDHLSFARGELSDLGQFSKQGLPVTSSLIQKAQQVYSKLCDHDGGYLGFLQTNSQAHAHHTSQKIDEFLNEAQNIPDFEALHAKNMKTNIGNTAEILLQMQNSLGSWTDNCKNLESSINHHHSLANAIDQQILIQLPEKISKLNSFIQTCAQSTTQTQNEELNVGVSNSIDVKQQYDSLILDIKSTQASLSQAESSTPKNTELISALNSKISSEENLASIYLAIYNTGIKIEAQQWLVQELTQVLSKNPTNSATLTELYNAQVGLTALISVRANLEGQVSAALGNVIISEQNLSVIQGSTNNVEISALIAKQTNSEKVASQLNNAVKVWVVQASNLNPTVNTEQNLENHISAQLNVINQTSFISQVETAVQTTIAAQSETGEIVEAVEAVTVEEVQIQEVQVEQTEVLSTSETEVLEASGEVEGEAEVEGEGEAIEAEVTSVTEVEEVFEEIITLEEIVPGEVEGEFEAEGEIIGIEETYAEVFEEIIILEEINFQEIESTEIETGEEVTGEIEAEVEEGIIQTEELIIILEEVDIHEFEEIQVLSTSEEVGAVEEENTIVINLETQANQTESNIIPPSGITFVSPPANIVQTNNTVPSNQINFVNPPAQTVPSGNNVQVVNTPINLPNQIQNPTTIVLDPIPFNQPEEQCESSSESSSSSSDYSSYSSDSYSSSSDSYYSSSDSGSTYDFVMDIFTDDTSNPSSYIELEIIVHDTSSSSSSDSFDSSSDYFSSSSDYFSSSSDYSSSSSYFTSSSSDYSSSSSFSNPLRDTHTRSGKVFRDYREYISHSCETDGYETVYVKFDSKFEEIPHIAVAITGFKIDQGDFSSELKVVDTDHHGFWVEISCQPDVKFIEFAWLATISHKSGIYIFHHTLEIDTHSALNTLSGGLDHRVFKTEIDHDTDFKTPGAVVGLAGWAYHHGGCDQPNLDVELDSICSHGYDLVVKLKGDAKLSYLRVSVIHFEEDSTTHDSLMAELDDWSWEYKKHIHERYDFPITVWSGLSMFDLAHKRSVYEVEDKLDLDDNKLIAKLKESDSVHSVALNIFYTNSVRGQVLVDEF